MKKLSLCLKYDIIILTIFIIISNIISYENIPLWAHNENKVPLPDDLLNSEIIGMSLDNSTSKILYLLKEGDNSFLYINEKKYSNTLGNDLTYISSPLIENNNIYYFCSSKNIIKMDSFGRLQKIQNTNLLNGYNNYELKCFYMRKEKVIIVNYINTPIAQTYNIGESKWISFDYGEAYLKLGDKIIDSNLYDDDNIDIVRMGILYQEGSSYKFTLFLYNNYQFGGILYVTFNGEFYSKTIYSFGKEVNQVFVFTYEPQQLSKYNFFILDIGRSQCMKSKGYFYLKIFKETEIFDAYFIENSPALFYNIRKKELNGQYSFFIGAVDIEKLVILYNIKMDNYKKIFYNYSFLHSKKAFLQYFEDGNQIEICPFIYDSSNKLCQFYTNEYYYYIFDKSNGDIVNKMDPNCGKKIISNYCIEKCPIGFETIDGNKCNPCAETFYYRYASKDCIYNNEGNYPTNDYIIYNCAEKNLKFFDESCYQSCSDIYGIDTPNKQNECTSCKSQNQMFFESKCYENCDVLYGIINPDNENECILCKNENKIYFESNCYNNCSEIYGIINPDDENACISCKSQNKIFFEYNCYNSCSDIYGIINPDDENECISCKSQNKIYFETNCYNNCTEIYGIINPDDENECISCKNENKIYFDLNCYDNCSDIYGIINPDDENECIICNNENKIYLDNECVDECPDGYELINTEKYGYQVAYCQSCKEMDKFFYDKKCLDECPSKYQLYDESDNICYYCHNKSDDKIFYQNGTCVSNCSAGHETIITEDEKYCRFCKDEGKFLSHKNKCEDSCEKNSLHWEENNVCYFCNETKNKFRQDDTCVKECERGYETNKQDYICRNCYKENKYFYDGLCQDNCPDGLAWNDTNNICFDCWEELQKLYVKNNHSCLSQCGKMQKEGNQCIPCEEDKKYFFEYKCYHQCPNYTIATDAGLESYCRTCQYFYQDGDCVSECQTLYMQNIVEVEGMSLRICTKCGTDNKSWYEGENCVEYCPDSTYASEDHYCRFCFCGFSSHICDSFSDKCICDDKEGEGAKFGDNCEYFRQKFNKDLQIKNVNPTISSKKSIFTYNLANDIKKKYPKTNYIYVKNWKVFINNNEQTDVKYFAAGVNEEIFIINPNLLKAGKENKLTLDLNIKDLKNNSIKKYHDEIEISIQSLERNSRPELITPDKVNKVMSNIIKITIDKGFNRELYKLYYKLLIVDEYNETIPIKQKEDLEILLTRTNDLNNPLQFYLPIFDSFIFELSNNREEVIPIYLPPLEIDNRDIKYSLYEIIKGLYSFEDYSDIERIFLVMKYMNLTKGEVFNSTIYDLLLYFINYQINLVANEKGSFENNNIKEKGGRYYMNYIEAKTIFSLMNKIFFHQQLNIPEEYFIPFMKVFKKFWEMISSKRNYAKFNEKMPNSDILSFFRTFDHFLDIYKNKEINDIFNKLDEEAIIQTLEYVSNYLVTNTYPGETIRLVGKRISIIVSHLSNHQKNLAFSSVNNISETLKYDDYNTFSFDNYYLNKEVCDDDGNTLFCIKPDDFNELKQNKIDKIDIDKFGLAIFKINKNGKNLENENVGDTMKLYFLYDNKEQIDYINYPIEGIFYDIELSLKDIIIPNDRKEFYIQTNEKDYSNITCIPKNFTFNKKYYCFTYFNYQKDLIKCSCNIFEEITYVSNYSLAKFYKDLQSKSAIKKYNFLNKISLILVFIIILLVFVPGCFYLLYDIKYDIKRLDINLMTFSEKIKQKYLQVKILNKASIFSFAFYTSFFQFPFLSPLRICNYRSPKYIKHFIIILSIFYGFIISLIFFYIFVPSIERKVLIDKRDIKNPHFEIYDMDSYQKYIKRGFIFSIIGVILTRIIIYVFGIILNYNKDELVYWREMKTVFTNYITNEIKGNVLLGPTWNKIKNRMIAYINICGDYILSKIKKKNYKFNKNFENYLSKIEKVSEYTSSTYRLFPSLDFEEGINLDGSDSKSNKSGNYRPPSIGSINSSNSSKNKSKRYNLNVEIINNSATRSSRNTDSANSKKPNIKVVNTDSFQLYSRKIKKNKTLTKNNKFERIKNKYICTRKNKVLYEIEIDSMSENMSSYNEYYNQLSIENEINLSYYPIQEFITNETLNYHSENTWVTTKLNLKFKPEGYWHLIMINAILFLFLFILIIIIFSLDKIFLNHFGSFIIKVWLSSSIIIYLVIYPFLYYIKNLIGSFLIFKCYHLKNRALFYKILFGLFVNKTMIYIFKVRNYITKYKNELDY